MSQSDSSAMRRRQAEYESQDKRTNQYPYHKNLIPIPASNRTFEHQRPHMDIDESKKEPVMRDHENSEPMRTDIILFQFTLTMNLLLEKESFS